MASHVLVIDDEKVIRDGCSRVLVKEGHEVSTASGGEEGIGRMEQKPADVVLLDLMMPGIDGFETLSRIRERWPKTDIIIITGFATVEKAVQAMKQGAFDFLAKPFNPDYLRIVVRRALDKRSLEEEAIRLREEREAGLKTILTERSRIRTILNSMESGLLVVGYDMTVLLHNPTLIRILEIQADPMVNKPLRDCVLNQDLCDLVREVTENGVTISREFEENTIGAAYLRAHCAPVVGQQGEILGSVTVFEDLSALKRVDKLKSEFVAMVSHEIRAPLASVEQMAYVLRDGLAGDISDQGKAMVERILVRTKELLQLVRNLLDLSRIETGILVQNMEPIDVNELVAGVIDMIRPQADVKNQTLDFQCEKPCSPVVGDRDNLIGVFNNIIGNAVKYTPEDGRIEIRVAVDGSFIRVGVTDNGIGIPKADLDRIFDRFYRVKGKTRGITGSGLGLSVAKSIVEAHRGTIHVSSGGQKGSTFEVMLPIQA